MLRFWFVFTLLNKSCKLYNTCRQTRSALEEKTDSGEMRVRGQKVEPPQLVMALTPDSQPCLESSLNAA